MILDNLDRLVIIDQSTTSPLNEPHRSPGFAQKQPPEVFCKKRCSLKSRKFHRKTPVFESLFNNFAGLQAWNFIKKILQHWCFPMKNSHLPKNFLLFASMKAFEKCFLFHLKSSFRSQDIYFGHVQKTAWIDR